MTAVLAALVAAACFAFASVAQHRAASTTPSGGGLRLVARMVSRPLWLLGVVAGVVGFAAQALALATGSLVVVQLVLVSGLAMALPMGVVLERRRPRPAEWAWAASTIAGLVLFLAAARPSAGVDVAAPATLAVASAVCGLVVLLLVVLGSRLSGRYRAVALGFGGGVAFGVAGALAKQAVDVVARDGWAVLTTWSPWALAVAALLGVVLTQASYRAGVLAAAQPAITVGEPLAAAVLGALAFSEHLAPGPLAHFGEAAAAVVMVASVVGLAHCSGSASSNSPSPMSASSTPASPTPAREPVAASAKE